MSDMAPYDAMIADGISLSDVLARMRDDGVAILEAIKWVRAVNAVDLGEAKRMVSLHPSWGEIVVLHADFHDEVEEALRAFDEPPFR